MKAPAMKSMPRNLAFMAILVFITFKYLIQGFTREDINTAISISQKGYVMFAIFFSVLYMFCEAVNTRRILNVFGYDVDIFKTVRYAFTGFFFAALTPSATGGQPVQVYVMKKEGIRIPHSSLVLMIELCSFQLVTVVMALIGYYYSRDYIFSGGKIYLTVITVGILMNFFIFLFIFFAIFSKRFIMLMKRISYFLIDKMSFIKDKEAKKDFFEKGLEEYRYGAVFIKANKVVALKTFLTTTVQVVLMYSISFLVYRSLGLDTLSFTSVFFLQALAFVSVSAMPLPGAIGISEKVFNFLFLPVYDGFLNEGLILTRGINFYFLFAVSAVIFFTAFNKYIFEKKVANE